MRWNEKKFSAAKSILGAGRRRMEMSAVRFFFWSASYLKLRPQQHNSNIHIIHQQVQTINILCAPAKSKGLLLGHMGTVSTIIMVVFVYYCSGQNSKSRESNEQGFTAGFLLGLKGLSVFSDYLL